MSDNPNPALNTPSATTPVQAAPAQQAPTSTPAAGPPAPPGTSAYLTWLQGQAGALERKINDPATDYNARITELENQLKALGPPTIANEAAFGPLNDQLRTLYVRRDDDRKQWSAWLTQVNAEINRQQEVALKSTTLTQAEKDALSAQQALAQRQQAKVDADIKQEAARFAWEMDPTNLAAKKALDDSTRLATEANTRYTEARTELEKLDVLYGPATRQAALDSAYIKLEGERRTLAAGGPEAEVGLTRAQIAQYEAQTRAAELQRQVHEQELKEHQFGPLGTFINQVTATAAAGLITPQQAETEIAAFVKAQQTGATPYEWQSQADTNARAITQSIMQSGQATAPGQQFMVGGEPGGILEQAAGQWGFQPPSVQLAPTTAPAYMQSLGMTSGAPVPVAGVPSAPVAGAPAAYAASLPGGMPIEDWSGSDLRQVHATLSGAAPPMAITPGVGIGPAAPPPAAAPSNVVLPMQPGAAMGGVNNGLALGPIITGAPNYARITP